MQIFILWIVAFAMSSLARTERALNAQRCIVRVVLRRGSSNVKTRFLDMLCARFADSFAQLTALSMINLLAD